MAKTINQKEIQAKIKEVFGKDSNLVLKALKVANKKHKGELRDDGTPYVEHPIRVAEYSYEFKKSKNASMIYMASLLHDTIEDTYTSYRELDDMFGREVASLVMELSTAKFAPACLEGGKAVLFGPLFYFYFLALLLRNMGEKQRFEEAIWICLQMESG